MMDSPKFEPGQRVEAMDDIGNWDEAWIVEVIPTYNYTIRRPASKHYRGGPIVGVFKEERHIREPSSNN